MSIERRWKMDCTLCNLFFLRSSIQKQPCIRTDCDCLLAYDFCSKWGLVTLSPEPGELFMKLQFHDSATFGVTYCFLRRDWAQVPLG